MQNSCRTKQPEYSTFASAPFSPIHQFVVNYSFELWCVIIGAILLSMALLGSLLKRLPLTMPIVYLGVGLLMGTQVGWTLIDINALEAAPLLHRLAEVAVIVSLFTAGLKLRVPLTWQHWNVPLRLSFLSMTLTVAGVAGLGVWLLGLSVGAAILLGAILAPTDPVLASDVQINHPYDRDSLRFSLTGEAGLNDGTAFPFVMLGLGLSGLHEIGEFPFAGWRWLAVDVLWAVGGGLTLGAILGTLVARFVLYLRRTHQEAVGLDDFLAIGLIAFSYGLALKLETYGFLAVFAAGVALRAVERRHAHSRQEDAPVPFQAQSGTQHPVSCNREQETDPDALAPEAATHPEHAPGFMARAMLQFNEQLERIGEVAMVIILGVVLTRDYFRPDVLWFVAILFLLLRPIAVVVGCAGAGIDRSRLAYMSWFGVRGIGSIYYLMYAVEHGLGEETAHRLIEITLTTIAASIVIHGISVTPMMNHYARSGERLQGT